MQDKKGATFFRSPPHTWHTSISVADFNRCASCAAGPKPAEVRKRVTVAYRSGILANVSRMTVAGDDIDLSRLRPAMTGRLAYHA